MNPKNILDNLSGHLKNTIAKSITLADSFYNHEVAPLHILLALQKEVGSVGAEVLFKLEIEEKHIAELLPQPESKPKIIPTGSVTRTLPELNEKSRTILERAMLLAYEQGHSYVGTEHLLYSIIESADEGILKLLENTDLTPEEIFEQLEIVFKSTSRFPEMDDVVSTIEQLKEMTELEEVNPDDEKKPKHNRSSLLEIFTTNLTDTAIQKNIDPVIGREKEIERLMYILCRRTKNNPVLVGEPGVGKTAIVEGLAKKIALKEVPEILQRKKVLSLDLTLLISGTIYRGEFEARLKQIIEEVSKREDVILFIDELHNIIGAGSNQGTMDAANILKPALARGQLRCIGATTYDEYKKHIQSDPALERRFEQITIEEPNRVEALHILKGIAPHYEAYHQVKILPEALEAAVDLSTRYIHDNFLPDKAIDLIDEACASVRIHQKISEETKRTILLKTELEECTQQKEEAIANEKFDQAKILKKKEEEIKKRLAKIENTKKKEIQFQGTIDRATVAHILAQKIQIDETILLQDEWTQLESLFSRLQEHILGQDTALNQIIKTLQHSHLRQEQKKPFASFLFVGPSGVGKTELAKILAKTLYHDEKALIKLDMSEFSEGHGISKLLGSPAGYVGHKERNYFADEIRKRPYSIILFDEIDKAHHDVMQLLLQILDEGVLTESNGKKIHFAHCILVLTSNVGAEIFTNKELGFGQAVPEQSSIAKNAEKNIHTKLKEVFGAPLLGRIDSTVLFPKLSLQTIEGIVEKSLQHTIDRIYRKQKIQLKTDKKVIEKIARDSQKNEFGARHIQKTVDSLVHNAVLSVLQQQKHKKSYILKEKNGDLVIQ